MEVTLDWLVALEENLTHLSDCALLTSAGQCDCEILELTCAAKDGVVVRDMVRQMEEKEKAPDLAYFVNWFHATKAKLEHKAD